jgi:glycosyltransferase involved in cell wall biosynthesis
MKYELSSPRCRQISVDVVVPVYNESRDLEASIRRLRHYLDDTFPFDATVTIADNASTDNTWDVASRLERELPSVRALHLERKGRGRALRMAWTRSEAEILAYMDVDLSTDLDALLPLIAPLASGHSELAIGSRLARGSRVVRGPKRESISRSYNVLLRALLHTGFSDAQCGFKAIRASEAALLLPLVEDNEWFFDTELLVLAERNGLRIHEVPVDWFDDPDSRVHLAHTAIADLRGIGRLLRSFGRGGGYVETIAGQGQNDDLAELGRFAGLGVANPLAYVVAYLLLFLVLGTSMNSYVANGLALALCTAGTALLHRVAQRHRRRSRAGDETVASALFAMSLSVIATTWCLAAAIAIDRGSLVLKVGALVTGSAIAAAARFLIRRASTLHVHLRDSLSTGVKVRPERPASPSREPLPSSYRGATSTGFSPERKS